MGKPLLHHLRQVSYFSLFNHFTGNAAIFFHKVPLIEKAQKC